MYMYLAEISSPVTSKSHSEDRNEVTINQRSYIGGFLEMRYTKFGVISSFVVAR